MARLANRVNVGGSVAPWVAYRTLAPPGAGWACWARLITSLTFRVGALVWYASSAPRSDGSSDFVSQDEVRLVRHRDDRALGSGETA